MHAGRWVWTQIQDRLSVNTGLINQGNKVVPVVARVQRKENQVFSAEFANQVLQQQLKCTVRSVEFTLV